MKPVAVIILNWNGAEMLRRYLPSVVEHTPADIADIIVADNGSTDGSLELLRREMPGVRLLPFAENHGYAGGYNMALEQTGYEYTVLLNSDVTVHDDWLTPLYRFMLGHERAAAVQPKIMSMAHPELFEYAGAAGGWLDRNGYPYCRGRIFDTVETDHGQYDADMQVHWASGAALMVRTAAYLDAGGLDATFFAHMEEIDLCWRLRLAGREIWACGASRVYHLGGGSLPASSPRKTYLNFRNSLLMLHKNLPESARRGTLLRRRLLDTVAWAKMMATLDFSNANALLRAHRDYRRMARSQAAHPGATANLLGADPQSSVNIIAERYLKGRRTYGAIFPND